MRAVTSALAVTLSTMALSAFPGTAFAQALTFEVEGEITNVTPVGSDFVVKVMGTSVNVPGTLDVNTPTASMKASEFFGGYLNKDLPGISGGNGFKGGTAIVLGVQTGDTVDAVSFFTDYHENVVLGGVTKDPYYNYAEPPAGSVPDLYVSGMKIIPLPKKGEADSDPRYPGLPFQNEYGFEVKKELPLGSLTAVEGYMDQSGAMRAFLVETDLGTLVRAGQNEGSALRGQCRQRSLTNIELSVSGTAHGTVPNGLPNTRVQITAAPGNAVWYGTTIPSAPLTVDGENPLYYLYSYSFKGTPTQRQGCPLTVAVRLPDGSSAQGEVDLRID
jgi:hypothetical protein